MKQRNISQDLEELVIRYITGDVTSEEISEVEKWYHESPNNRKFIHELQNIYHLTRIQAKPSGFDKQAGWNRVKADFFEKRYNNALKENKLKIKRTIWRIAASFVAIVALGFVLYQLLLPRSSTTLIAAQNSYNEVIAPIGSRISQVILSDGTQVWLNAGSRLRYPAIFNEDAREVFIEGEAFFDVTDGKNLFVVKTSDVDIKVYGTRFNVKSYPEEDLIETTLVEGSLSVEPTKEENAQEIIMIKPNQKVTFYKSDQNTSRDVKEQTIHTEEEGEDITVKSGEMIVDLDIDLKPITSWKDEKWFFSSEPLGQLAVKLERRYAVIISFEGETIKDYKFTGTFTDETFEQILEALKLGAPVAYSIDKNQVTIKEDPAFKLRYDEMISDSD